MSAGSTTHKLFGGAITAILPEGLIDASELRQVPDTQELLLYPNSSASIILEVLEKVDKEDPSEVVKFHFDSIAHDNEAQSSVVHAVQHFDANAAHGDTPTPTVIYGTQHVIKFNKVALDEVLIFVAVWRIEPKNVDLVLTFNVPVKTQDGGALNEDAVNQAKGEFETAVQSLNIVDMGLFV